MINNQFDLLHTNQRLLALELIRRGVDVFVLDEYFEVIEAQYQGHHEFILDRFSSIVPHNLVLIARDKYLAKYILDRNGISVAKSKLFDKLQINEALEYASELNYPIVLKPNSGSHGDNIFMNILDEDELLWSINILLSKLGDKTPFFVEEQFLEKEYRIFITKKGDYAVLHRDCAAVIGDGNNNIKQLIDIKNVNRTKLKDIKCLYPLVIDEDVELNLKKQSITFDYIPQKNQKIYLRLTSNIAKGGYSIDCTDIVHPSVIDIAKKILSIFQGLPFAGIDMLSTNITTQQDRNTYKILEVNPNPGFAIHMRPAEGHSRNVASFVADLIFPETSNTFVNL